MHNRLFVILFLFPSLLFLHKEYRHTQQRIILNSMTTYETKRLNDDIQMSLPKWRTQFEKYGQKYGVPWTLLAAVSYQESKWNNQAVSFTGVKGLMQLTNLTAQHVGIRNREDAEQSIKGGALYLKYLYNKSPQNLASSDRWVQALAGYNIGWAHLRDVHRLGRKKHLNANLWRDLKKLLPLKADQKYQKHFNFGLARGHETVRFIEGVIGYYQVLNMKFPELPSQRNIASNDSQSLLNRIYIVTN